MGLKKCIMSCIYHYSIIHNSFTVPLQSLYALTVHLSLPPGPGNHWSFHCFYSFAFSRLSRVGIILYVVFSDWLLLLMHALNSNMHIFLWLDSQLLFYHWIIFHCLDVPQFIYVFANRRTFLIVSNIWLLWKNCRNKSYADFVRA
jgi:hypothetical protein